MASFYSDVLAKSPAFHSAETQKSTDLLEPGMRAAVAALVAEAATHDHHLVVLETFRSSRRQQQLFAQHKTELRAVGCHGYGVACDLGITGPSGQIDWKADYTLLRALAKKHGLIWGGDWGTPKCRHSFQDMDHVQRVPVFRQPELFAGDWYPASTYDPYVDMEEHGVSGVEV
ncbi:MAG: M15 family metallopeptidase [Methylocystis sp.]